MLRAIPLRVVDAPVPDGHGGTHKIAWPALLRNVLEAPRPKGLQLAELRIIDRLLDALDSAERAGAPRLLVDEALWNYLVSAVEAHLWGAYLPAFVRFADDVISASAVDPNAPVDASARAG